MMKCIAVDDEKLVLELLEDNIRQVPYLDLVASCKNAMDATRIIQEQKIDLIFLDIQMPGLTGLQFLKTLPHAPMVILVTAYEKYALESYDLNVVDYLLKPVSFERFLKACNKAKAQFDLVQKEGIVDSIFVHVEYTLVKIKYAEILFLESMKDYLKIYLTGTAKPVLTKMSMKAMEEKLPADQFIRVHKSYIISQKHLTLIKRDFVLIADREIPVSDFYKENLERIINRMK